MTEPTNESTNEPTNEPSSAPDSTQAIPSGDTLGVPTPQYAYPGAPGSTGASSAAGVPAPGVGLADEPGGPSRSGGGKRTGLLIGGLAAVLVLGGAGVFAVQKLSGGGSQPAEVLPSDAYAYLRLDIDPSAGQKIAAVRFLGKLPDVKRTLEGDDARKKLWEMATKDASNDCLSKFSYDTDIAPWLGDRLGAAIRPGGTAERPNAVLALQVKDDAKAQDTITRLLACDKGADAELRMRGGYALITPKGVGDATVAAIDKGTLASNATFTADMTALGEQGVLSAWFDASRGYKELSNLGASTMGMSSLAGADVKGRFAAALRFDPGYVELAGIGRGAQATKAVAGNGAELANLPDDTAAALHIAGADQMLDNAWPQLKKQIDGLGAASGEGDVISQIESELDVKLPDDLKILLGSSFTLAMPAQDFQSDQPAVGAKVVSSDAKRADELVGSIEDAAGASGTLTRKVVGNKLVVATTPDYVTKLETGGRLGDSDGFRAALGDVSKANVAAYVDLDRLEKLYLADMAGDDKAFVEALRAVGLTVSATGDGEASFSLRLVGN